MTATNHALTGTVIALAVKQPALAIPLAFLSHFGVDLIPHFEARDMPWRLAKKFILTDLGVGSLLTILLPIFLKANVSGWQLFFCMVAAMSPDYIWCWRFVRFRDADKTFAEPMSWLSRLHIKIQWKQSIFWGWVEALWLILAISLIKIFAC